MTTEPIAAPQVVDRAEHERRWEQQVAIEKELTHFGDRVSARRRRLPMTPIEDYEFAGPEGPVRLSELFGEHQQLCLQFVMFHPDWTDGCPSCTWAVDNLPRKLDLLDDNSVAFAMVSRAPLEKLRAYQAKRGWDDLTWVSSAGTTFHTDWGWTTDEADQPGYSYLLKRGDELFLTYRARARGTEAILPVSAIWDRAVYGRQQDFEDSPDGWPQHPTYG
ncbi:DUF899 family protein [Auraticoccus monumenti]|uniref:Predicted dithiol-disulfide oxidoreductase, DUF899 family n=1 Tax=Auraticoccus monumenti TaxID=675864 RepID=A0A1G6T8E8_9ACTN|nr:DUF899 family protein [Auraticoccus monumenti]SDD24625.1 Predicted dithiol-disulfide oxidoreductase, DUF899 family [Auraticoccus monumenti]